MFGDPERRTRFEPGAEMMRKAILGCFGLLFALPQAASAQFFEGSHQYTAKFLCGEAPGNDSRLGVVAGHYNTIVNVAALRDRTALAYRATALSSNLEVDSGVPSEFSGRFDFDTDGGLGIVCRDIKNLLGVGGSPGFVEGFVTIYSSKPLNVTDVLTAGETDSDVTVMQTYPVSGRSASGVIRPPDPEP